MADDTQKKDPPPYTSYSTFNNFINGLQETGVPSRIDKSVIRTLSGSAQAALLSALKWLKLTDSVGTPTELLNQLVEAEGENKKKVLAEILTNSYPFASDSSFPLHKATGAQVEQKFRDFGITGSTVVKAVAFFIAAAKDANITLGPHVKAPKVSPTTNGAKRQAKKVSGQQNADEGKQRGDEDLSERTFEDKPGYMRITVPLHVMGDGAIYLPADMAPRQRAYALKITKFLLDNYWLDDETQTAIEQIEKDDDL
jgi:hypothetical protein